MNYNEILNYHKNYGTTKSDIVKRHGYENILKNVVIAPVWKHTLFEKYAKSIEQVSSKVFNVYCENFSFSFIETNNIGASWIIEDIYALGVTHCKNLIFIGSAGALSEQIKIGDLSVPKLSYCGVSATRYLNQNLEDDFETKDYPSEYLTNKLLNTLKANSYNTNYHFEENYTVDSLFTQFAHIDHIKNLGAKTIEMETANVFKCNELLKINITALFCISDNTLQNKSLYSGRTQEENNYRRKIRYEVIPEIVINLLKKWKDK